MMNIFELLLPLMIFVSITMLIYVFASDRLSARSLNEKLANLTSLDQGITYEETLMALPIRDRLLLPLFEWVGRVVGKYSPRGFLTRASVLLKQAGFYQTEPAVYLGICAALSVAFVGIIALFAMLLNLTMKSVLFHTYAAIIAGILIPNIWLRMAGEKRKIKVRKALPDLLDILTVSVEAGLGFDQALAVSAEKMSGPLIDEIVRVHHEIQLGMTRVSALRNMANRINLPECSAFVASLVQADQLGVPTANVLRVQSDSMRVKRRQRAEETAMKAPLKILFPLLIFILPSLFVIVLAPAVLFFFTNFKGK